MNNVSIIVHGGALSRLNSDQEKGMLEAIQKGFFILQGGGNCIDAVEEALKVAENIPVLNCGTGARLNLEGDAELDAAIMEGNNLNAGAVAALQKTQHPISVARKVMEETDHILLVGEGATKFARALNFKEYNPVTEDRIKEWKELREKIIKGEELPSSFNNILKYWSKLRKWIDDDTVGVVALDKEGNLAAGVSSGGGPLKMPGRVGDVPLIGAGIYVDKFSGGVVLTGHGEVFIKYLAAKTTCDFMKTGMNSQDACESLVKFINKKNPQAVVALIALDKNGNPGAARNVNTAPHAYQIEGMDKPRKNFAPIILP